MAYIGWVVQGHAAPWWTRPEESIHSQKPSINSVPLRHKSMASDMQSALAAALEVVLQGIGISTLDDLASRVVDHGDEIAAYITSSGCRRAGLVAAQERERAAQAVAAANSAAAAALQAATTACSRAELSSGQAAARRAGCC